MIFAKSLSRNYEKKQYLENQTLSRSSKQTIILYWSTEAAASGSSQGATGAAIDSGLSQDVVDAVIDSSASGSSDGAIVAAEIAGVDTSAIVDAAENGSSQGADAATTDGGSTIDVGDPVVTPPDDADEVIIASPEGPPTT